MREVLAVHFFFVADGAGVEAFVVVGVVVAAEDGVTVGDTVVVVVLLLAAESELDVLPSSGAQLM